jgi:hypothetical protein
VAELMHIIAGQGLYRRKETIAYFVATSLVGLALAINVVVWLLTQFSIISGVDNAALYLVGTIEILCLVLLLYCRGWLIDRWMQSTFIGRKRRLTLGALSDRVVDHVFCATELRRARPYFFSTAGGGRQFSEVLGRANAHDVPLLTAIRASAAFPPLVPPIRYKPRHPFGHLTAEWNSVPQFLDESLWLTDGGAFNNYGTDWRRLEPELWTAEGVYAQAMGRPIPGHEEHIARYGKVQLIVDAAQVDPPMKRSWLLWVPLIGWLSYVSRTMSILYGSTLHARSAASELAAQRTMDRSKETWRPHDPSFKAGSESRVLDDPLQVFIPYSLSLLDVHRRWGVFAHIGSDESVRAASRVPEEIEEAKSKLLELWPDQDLVPTDFHSLGYVTTFRLVIAGYLATRASLFAAFSFPPLQVPDKQWFIDLEPT